MTINQAPRSRTYSNEIPGRPLYILVSTWMLMVPMLYFAVGGVVRFDTSSKNSMLSNALLGSASDIRSKLALLLVGLICAALFSLDAGRIAGVLFRHSALAGLLLWAFASTIWSQFPIVTLSSSLHMVLNICFAIYLALRFRPLQQQKLFLLLGWIAVLLSIAVAIGFPGYGIDHRGLGTVGAWIGIFVHKNSCAVVVTYLLSAAFFVKGSERTSSTLRMLYIASSLFLIAMTRSRTAWICTAFLLLYVVAVKVLPRFERKSRRLVIACSVAGVLVLAAVMVQNYATIAYAIGKDPTMTGRTAIFNNVAVSAEKRPVTGYGYWAFFNGLTGESANASLASGTVLPTVDNGYLGLWVDLGAVGLVLFFLTLIRALRDAKTCFTEGADDATKWYLSIVLLAVVSNMAERMIVVPDYLPWIMYVMACVGLQNEARRIRGQRVL